MQDGSSASRWPLEAAIGDLRAVLRAGGAVLEGDEPTSHEWRGLRHLANERNLVREFDESLWRVGGAEHVCRRVEGDRWEKVTRRNAAGYFVDFEDMRSLPATPLQYLRRLELVNDLFADDIRLEGVDVGPGANDCRIRTSQPDVPGATANDALIVAWLAQWGFEKVQTVRVGAYDSVSCKRGAFWLFDVRPANFVLGPDGTCYPIDVLVQLETDDLSSW